VGRAGGLARGDPAAQRPGQMAAAARLFPSQRHSTAPRPGAACSTMSHWINKKAQGGIVRPTSGAHKARRQAGGGTVGSARGSPAALAW